MCSAGCCREDVSAESVSTCIESARDLIDAYLLYGPQARWDEQPPGLVSWGSTILSTRDSLSRYFKQALN